MNSRRDLERNMHMLSEAFINNTIKINRSLEKTIRGIRKARLTPNNRADFHTVDDAARQTANTLAAMLDHEEQKNGVDE